MSRSKIRNMDEVQDFAERVRKFYYSRALLCESFVDQPGEIVLPELDLPPQEYAPLNNLYIDAFTLSCAAIEGLASIWCFLEKQKPQSSERFTSFLIKFSEYKYLEHISTPFLFYELEREDYEPCFRKAIKSKWLDNREERQSHVINQDPTFEEIKSLYDKSSNLSKSKEENLSTKKVEFHKLKYYTYAHLIYKFYRCSFIHEFRNFIHTDGFNKKAEVSIRDSSCPKLDIGIGVLTSSIKRGADKVYEYILAQGYTHIPHNDDKLPKLEKKQPKTDSKKQYEGE